MLLTFGTGSVTLLALVGVVLSLLVVSGAYRLTAAILAALTSLEQLELDLVVDVDGHVATLAAADAASLQVLQPQRT